MRQCSWKIMKTWCTMKHHVWRHGNYGNASKTIDEKNGQNHVENIMEHWLNIMAKHKHVKSWSLHGKSWNLWDSCQCAKVDSKIVMNGAIHIHLNGASNTNQKKQIIHAWKQNVRWSGFNDILSNIYSVYLYYWHLMTYVIFKHEFSGIYYTRQDIYIYIEFQFQWPFQEPKLEVPTICKAYVRPM